MQQPELQKLSSSVSGKKDKKLDHGAIPRPCNLLNQTNARFGIPEKYESFPGTLELPPSASMPFYQID